MASIRKEIHINAHVDTIWDALRDVGAQFHYYNGTAQVTPHPLGGSHFAWTADLLPNELAPAVEAMMDAGIAVIKETMESARSVPMPPDTRETISARPREPARYN